ncbi:unnamed protein product [Calicophoron daubneyi]|uniref:Purine nucleoside phosphorylase n=1 Tax=Calicophoron daubneyi TaxID=300641 RepID=A0AAV2TPG5_CALDB
MRTDRQLTYEETSEVVRFIRNRVNSSPPLGIVCGSGLGKLADEVKDPQVIQYADIPNFPVTTVSGHEGNLVFGTFGEKPVVIMQGRFHPYEGYSNNEIATPIRVLKLLGVETLFVTNAAGSLNQTFQCGDFVVIKDHISLPGLALNNVLIGPNEERFGPRFVTMSDAYSSRLRSVALRVANENGFSTRVHEGVYVNVGGPTYETAAECRLLRLIGGDVVGMSTVPEVVVARHAGMEVFAISLVTNICGLEGDISKPTSHEEVLHTAQAGACALQKFLVQMVSHL